MNPVLPLSLLLPLALLVTLALAVLGWRASDRLQQGKRILLCALRSLGVLGLMVLLINPGKWVRPRDSHTPPWLLLVDRSASMGQAIGEQASRFEQALELARASVEMAEERDIPLEVRGFDSSASEPMDPGNLSLSRGRDTNLASSLNELLAAAAAAGKSYSGVVVLSDGRQTREPQQAQMESLALRLRSHHSPFHGVVVGIDQPARDLALIANRPSITGFAGQKIRIPFVLKSKDLKPLKPVVRLLDAGGEEVGSQAIEIKEGQTLTGAFEIPCPESSCSMQVVTEVIEGEVISSNNRDSVRVQVLDSKTRVFLAEGAPYWDSKFLAQLLRQQSHIELHSVHRIANDRYFHINSGEQDLPEGKNQAVFPQSLEELSRYDLIVFGKNTDAFLDPATTLALRSYVRDRGGAILFSRGKPTTARHPGLEALEPVSWGAGLMDDFRFQPSRDGASAALFGDALPGIEDPVWTSLPPLKDARSIATIKPFSRILAQASGSRDHALSQGTPALVVRRYGQGVTGLMNGDGLWKWDFYPEARELGNMYEDFWVQLIQWMASYSEFMPGHDYAIRLSPASCLPEESVTITLSYRGSESAPDPALLLQAPDGSQHSLKPTRLAGADNHTQWRASFAPQQVGVWSLRVSDKLADASGEKPTTSASLEVLAPPSESDNLSADPDLMTQLAEATEGQIVSAAQLRSLLESAFTEIDSTSIDANAVWQPSWTRWPIALFLLLPFLMEWLIRRRQGLA
ncbi:MAG: VWA domain-containing protein [Akkermansiaceae bacterium]|nr:VWA domain-containing protein [Akkermansiaceae bacterium]